MYIYSTGPRCITDIYIYTHLYKSEICTVNKEQFFSIIQKKILMSIQKYSNKQHWKHFEAFFSLFLCLGVISIFFFFWICTILNFFKSIFYFIFVCLEIRTRFLMLGIFFSLSILSLFNGTSDSVGSCVYKSWTLTD